MDFLELVTKRKSIRGYEERDVPKELINRVLECARMAPSAKNIQPWHFVVITDEKKRLQLKEAYPREWFFNAPVIICICGVEKEAWSRYDGKSYFDVDLAIAFDHLTLAATEAGLGTCWIGAFKPNIVKEALNLPDNITPLALTPLGFPKDAGVEKRRKRLDEIVHWDHW